uniref:Uncharacterized protein n=1 Tax=Lotus japonicus TaxID=34305 RepID=I3S228_LOTJA|nr:unknown [Lotus japonicus]
MWSFMVKRGCFKLLVFGLIFLQEKVGGAIPKQQYSILCYHRIHNPTFSKGNSLECLFSCLNIK